MIWLQKIVVLPPYRRGFHLITPEIIREIPEIARMNVGLCHLFIQHTSASLTINENADRDVRDDLESTFCSLVPETLPYRHVIEGPDDMPAHVKSSLLGSSLSIPIRAGTLALGTWQGIYLCEHRNHGGQRHLVVTVFGDTHEGSNS